MIKYLFNGYSSAIDGYEAALRSRKSWYKRPIFKLTAHAFKEEDEKALFTGYSNFVSKPIDRGQQIWTLSANIKSYSLKG